MNEQTVYVIWDPLYERPICVHADPGMECDVCKPLGNERRVAYHLEEQEFVIKTKYV